ncbi:tRNA (uridine(54)-C5)-methyltransferase TrmA [Aestuariirhabdus litorea]|uniref:tRNA/tmRNA (uracil-C(5))-methyltransferase n=1 Tax=Aestuariirhabdus litorea TaxID=2528527 RepID=A0A3P3VLM7_9GAMM|nr:tRNA (uridine(54)-C5)-methyltransferase TrmA [Aestuariirhabdus litorea]RRJ83237.1 tRNA (uridine(54)-C5)-methyltransferase TrmA [Aestuariirhabdus litorea]RWW93394.1 tRNA (uridine(54)-C5)-methyltransferase TrmA [Endozoicomonadaceae bacterium GTF-13]
MTLGRTYPEQYQQQLDEKAQQLEAQFADLAPPALEVFASAPEHFRMRAEFRIWHEAERSFYAMHDPNPPHGTVEIRDFPIASELINRHMQPLMTAICAEEILRRRLFQVEFLSTQSGELLITLIYHKRLDEAWVAAATGLRQQLGVDLIGRARKQKICLDRDFVNETLCVDGRAYHYQQVENSFTQPNAGVSEKMLAWALEATRGSSGDLLELYCGNANFTTVLAQNFERVLATEISKTSVQSAQLNLARNGVDNVEIVRMSSEEFTQAMNRERPFRRLSHIDLDSYRFGTIFVDPPRAGLDPATEQLVQRFERVVYISCNPDTLRHNLDTLCQSHAIERFALFDQFPYSHHREAGVLLTRR